ncbi:GGDEF domain-containing protein, partial [Klebsiella pneumoniae]
ARLGGDEFTVIVEDVQDVRHVARAAQKLVDALISPLELENQEIFATTSIGIAIYPSDGEDADVLLMNADTAMYRAKESGKNTFEFFTTDM